MADFQSIAERFRRAVLANHEPLFNDACEEAARAFKRNVEAGRLKGSWATCDEPYWPSWDYRSNGAGCNWRTAWIFVASILQGNFEQELPHRYAGFTMTESASGARVARWDQGTWRRLAEAYATICDWLAIKLAAENGHENGHKKKSARPDARNQLWLKWLKRKTRGEEPAHGEWPAIFAEYLSESNDGNLTSESLRKAKDRYPEFWKSAALIRTSPKLVD